MNEKELTRFVKWLPSNVDEFKDKTPEEIVIILNKLSQTEEGMSAISEFINQFKKNSQMLKKGGKIDYLVEKYKGGGQSNQEYSNSKKDNNLETVKEFKVFPADTTNNIVTQRIIYRRTPDSMQTEITRQYPVNKPNESSYFKRMHTYNVGDKGTKTYTRNYSKDPIARFFGQKPSEELVSLFREYYPGTFK